MSELIDRKAFIENERKLYCEDCDRRKGTKNGKPNVICYEIGEAPCRACMSLWSLARSTGTQREEITALEAQGYDKLVEALRCNGTSMNGSCVGKKCGYYANGFCESMRMHTDAADAIEALQAEVDEAKQYNTDLLNMKEMTKEEEDEILEYIRTTHVGPLEPMLIEQFPKLGEMKNADKIRAMTDEELAKWVTSYGRYFGEEYEGYMSCLDWLKEEVQE